jgi:hypothetical protein
MMAFENSGQTPHTSYLNEVASGVVPMVAVNTEERRDGIGVKTPGWYISQKVRLRAFQSDGADAEGGRPPIGDGAVFDDGGAPRAVGTLLEAD